MNESDIVLVTLLQADGRLKIRPGLVLRVLPPFSDLFVCGISTQLHQEVKGFDDLITVDDDDFVESGLRTTSLIRLGFLGVVPTQNVMGSMGSVDSQRHQKLLKRLAAYLTQNLA